MVVLLLAASEIGYRIGRRLKAGADDAMRSEIYTLQAATLALLALLLGFSFSLGASAYENRRRVILNETLVIAKAHQRADLLPEPTRSEVRELLIQYIDTRLDLFYQGAFREHVVRARLRESQRLQHEIWERAVAVALGVALIVLGLSATTVPTLSTVVGTLFLGGIPWTPAKR